VGSPGNIQHSSRHFDPGMLASFSARAAGGLAAHDTADPIEVLIARFPVIRRLVGDESFRAMARRFIVREPPRTSTLLHYGETFPCFLRRLGDTASIEYVADIAELEMTRGKAYHAADALPVGAQSLRPEIHKGRRLVLHPSVFLVSSRFPIFTIWKNNQSDNESTTIELWRGECALVARPFLEVQVQCLPCGGHAFINALSEGHTMAMAIEAGKAVTRGFDTASNLAILSDANIVVGFREDA
jgi:hypothetical protein